MYHRQEGVVKAGEDSLLLHSSRDLPLADGNHLNRKCLRDYNTPQPHHVETYSQWFINKRHESQEPLSQSDGFMELARPRILLRARTEARLGQKSYLCSTPSSLLSSLAFLKIFSFTSNSLPGSAARKPS